jgi:hypothetical protein
LRNTTAAETALTKDAPVIEACTLTQPGSSDLHIENQKKRDGYPKLKLLKSAPSSKVEELQAAQKRQIKSTRSQKKKL